MFRKKKHLEARDETAMNKEINPAENLQQSTLALINQSIGVILTNLIPLYGVWNYGWNSFTLIQLFIAEAVIVFFTDVVKRFFGISKKFKQVLFFEFVFIFFFGFFAILIFGRDENSSNLIETVRSSFSAINLPLWPLLSLLIMRALRLGQDLLNAGRLGGRHRGQLYYSGGGWMLLLFFLVMTAPFIADKAPNPMAGLIAIIVLKTLGEQFAVWAARISTRLK